VRLRQRKGYTQLRVAEGLCAVSGVTTITRDEVSRWERQERVPSVIWLRWLAVVLEVPVAELAAAAAVTREATAASASARRLASAATAAANGARLSLPPRTVQDAAPRAGTPRKRGNGGDPLLRVTVEFEHRTTSVRLSATYDDPRRALSVIEAFRSLVGDGEPVEAKSGPMQPESHPAGAEGAEWISPDGAAQRAHVVLLRQQRRSNRATAALTASKAADSPMGIRYKRSRE
jgi:transcriptional regulator with XRE-family HTH domain